ncbi:MAG: flavodoxin-dependent (E)-4-hydroxy-3-methylbut-2-enyl-diphosphate synthase [Sedimentisphaerales bacterium]|nr:flavodoxin-dependent (E)-4-hydroxy-3-methylbut-2-enyl-diphosphate synthase [Sedimentisphaerales bacterium]
MIERRKTTTAVAGTIHIGFDHPVVIQSMTKVLTTDVDLCIRQIRRLTKAGCDLVRIAVPTRADTRAFARIVQRTGLSLVADIHFSPERAIEAIEGGAAKIRLNPGNIKKKQDIERIIDCAKMHGIAIRIGVNEASIRDLRDDVGQDRRVDLMVQELGGYVAMFEQKSFTNLVLSVKSADTVRTIEANRAVAGAFGYPIHIGLTHAGLPDDATVPSAVALGTLLAEGIGDTIRVSVAGDPVKEVQIAQQILQSVGLYESRSPTLIVCPTCGRCQIDVVKLARQVRRVLKEIHKPVRVAVMGCVVNGPGEAADADVAVCAAKGKGFLYRNGKKIAVIPEEQLIQALRNQLDAF